MPGLHLLELILIKKSFDIFDEISAILDFICRSGLKLGEELNKNKIIEDLGRSVKIIKMSG